MRRWVSLVGLAALVIELGVAALVIVLGVPASDVRRVVVWVAPLTLLFLAPSIQELAKPRPRLTVHRRPVEADPSAFAPWPVDIDRVVRTALDDARRTAPAPRTAPPPDFAALSTLVGRFAAPPTDEELEKAAATFERDVAEYEVDLREWLRSYVETSRQFRRTVAMTLEVENHRDGAFAEGVVVRVTPPPGATVEREAEPFEAPPRMPVYHPPPRTSLRFGPGGLSSSRLPSLGNLAMPSPISLPRQRGWVRDGDGRLEFRLGELHGDDSSLIPNALLLRFDRPGDHRVAWVIYSRSLRKPVRGTLTVHVPAEDDSRPAFGRLSGVLRYPDVPLASVRPEITDTTDMGQLDPPDQVTAARLTDPPLQPPTASPGASKLEQIQHSFAARRWDALGLEAAQGGTSGDNVPSDPDCRRERDA